MKKSQWERWKEGMINKDQTEMKEKVKMKQKESQRKLAERK